MLREIDWVLDKLAWMRQQKIWPNGLRYLWTDAFGVVLLVSLYEELGRRRYLDEAEWVVAQVDRVLGRPRGLRIGEEPDRDGQYYHYLAMWMYALHELGRHKPEYQDQAIALVREVHEAFVRPDRGVVWKMKEDLSGRYPGYGYGALDAFHGYVVYRMLQESDAKAGCLDTEIADMRAIVERQYPHLDITQDLALGMMLWICHFYPDEPWARVQRERSLQTLDSMWIEPPGYFSRHPHMPHTKFRFTNYGVSVGLQAVDAPVDRVHKLNAYFDHFSSGDEYDTNAITHVMSCNSRFPGRLISRRAMPEQSTLERPQA
ncbi:hypothetical protein FIV42_02235 [Persicimonas caeni]|uniref:Uncharacterized protein n=1 Tax=Persicimonas caeni TaxID=2292766 RepID=A0A4Y6PMR4_PERCE|nr:hypothetical protein [Persicimonas caeni]QDG49598.1 hypothetical protein FIV42_02235 [Persicimonas caeni]QED30819.1 hypothetical protein FRD00_02230 [Persicimonas caeni]